MRMRAAVLEEFGAPLDVREVELTDPKAGEDALRTGTYDKTLTFTLSTTNP